MDRLTLAVASGTSIAWGGKDAYAAWQRSRSGEGDQEERAARQSATLANLARLFPGSVRSN